MFIQGDFVSLELRGGKVKFQYSTGQDSETYTLQTSSQYNTNEWVSVSAIWAKREGKLNL